MKNRRIAVYVLTAAWNDSLYMDHSRVLGVYTDARLLRNVTRAIERSRAKYYSGIQSASEVKSEEAREEKDGWSYEIVAHNGRYAKFSVTTHEVDLPESLMGSISREMEKVNRSSDISSHLQELYEDGELEAWKYTYMSQHKEVMERMLECLDKYADCNVPYNTTVDIVIKDVAKNILLCDEVLETLWRAFGDVPINDDDEIEDPFLDYPSGTNRFEVWLWFDRNYSRGIAGLACAPKENE